MGVTAAIGAAVVLAGTTVAVQSNQNKIAQQKQKDALSDAEKRQQELIDKQTKADADRKAKEQAATQSAFQRTAAARRPTSGAALPGAVAASAIGTQGSGAAAGKKLIGS